MKILIDETTYEGTAAEILDQLRFQTFDKREFPSTEAYFRFVRDNVCRMTDSPCALPEGSLEERSAALLDVLEELGALERLAA